MKKRGTKYVNDFNYENEKWLRQERKTYDLFTDEWVYFSAKARFFTAEKSELGQVEGLTLAHWSLLTDCLQTADMLRGTFGVFTNFGVPAVIFSLCNLYQSSGWLRSQRVALKNFRKNVLPAVSTPDLRKRMKGVCDEHEIQIRGAFRAYRKLARICLKLIPNNKLFAEVAKDADVK